MNNAFQMSSMMGQLSDTQLAQIAQQPTQPGEQLLAVQELDRRKQMRSQSTQKPPQSTVLQDRIAETMPVQQSAAHGDPFRAGLAAIQQQHGAQMMQAPPPGPNGYANGGLVRGYAGGGSVTDQYLGDLHSVMPAMQQAMGGPQTPQDWLSLASQFQGPDRLAPFEQQLTDRQAHIASGHHRDIWLALARAGFDMASTGDIGHGGLAGLSALQDADHSQTQEENALLQQHMGLASARQTRDDSSRNAAFSGYTGRQDTAFRAGLGAAGDISHIRESQADRAAANWRDSNDVQVLAQSIFQANQGRMVQDGEGTGHDPRVHVPFMRPYNMSDALREASDAYTQRYTGRPVNYAASAGAAARAVLNQVPPASAEARAQAEATLAHIQALVTSGAIPSDDGGGAGLASATGTQTAGERTAAPSQGSLQQYQQRVRPSPSENQVHQLDAHGNEVFPS